MMVPLSPAPAGGRGLVWLGFGLYLAFVVYGSLVPFEPRPLAWEQALAGFQRIPYLDLGVVSRADWIANIVLYVPLAFLGCSALLGVHRPRWWTPFGLGLVLVVCLTVALGLEFAQQWFVPRTVSQNDLIAETIGSLIGVLLWVFGRARIAWALAAVRRGGRGSVLAALLLAGLGYLLITLFPFDFVLSSAELQWKLRGENWGLLLAPSCGGFIRCGAGLVIDVLAVAPLGLLAVLYRPRLTLGTLFLVGLAMGLVLEPFKLLLASGVTQGLAVPLRGLGLVLGGLAGNWLARQGVGPAARLVVRAAPLLLLPYLAAVLAVSGWFAVRPVAPAEALARLAGVRWLPLYYQYFTTEMAALTSALAQFALYAPIGVWAWARAACLPLTRGARGAPWGPMAVAAGLAVLVEAGKLFFPPARPDPTNVLIAPMAVALVHALVAWLERVLAGAATTVRNPVPRGWDAPLPDDPVTVPVAARHDGAGAVGAAVLPTLSPSLHRGLAERAGTADQGPPADRVPGHPAGGSSGWVWPRPRPLGVLLAVPAGLAWVAGVASFPLAWPILGAALVLYGFLLWSYPLAWWLVVPALLPALDLSPWTGRLALDAFDLVVLTTLVVGYLRCMGVHRRPWPNRLYPGALALLWVAWIVAMVRGLWPLTGADWPPADASHAPVEAWMLGKGMLWALLLVPLARRVPPRRLERVRDLFGLGMLAGLALVALVVLWERHVTVGLGDFANEFRVTGPFASMHTGGAYIEAFLAFAFPFLVVRVLCGTDWRLRTVGVLLAALSAYAMMVTFSRGGWAGLLAGLLVVALGQWRGRGGRSAWVAAAVLVGAVAAASVPVLMGGFARERLAGSGADLRIRLAHWERAVSLMTPGPAAVLLGEGFGQYPTAYLMGAAGQRPPGTFAILREGANPYLRLGPGESVFLDQSVGVAPGRRYRLAVRARQAGEARPLVIPICEKALLYSFQCERVTLTPPSGAEGWVDLTAEFDSGRLGAGGHWPHPSVKIALPNSSAASGPLDLDDLSLRDPDGRELIVNGDFGQGARRWLFVTDQDLAWHIHELWVEVYFAQGVLGILTLLLVLTAAGLTLWRVLRGAEPRGQDLALALAAGLAGILTVGLLGSVADTARLAMLLYMGALIVGALFPGIPRHRRGNRLRGSAGGARQDGAPGAPPTSLIASTDGTGSVALVGSA